MLTRGGICVPPTVTYLYLPYRVSRSTLTAVGRSQWLARWPGTHCQVLSGIQRATQTVSGVYLKRTCSRVTNASSALGVLDDYALYKSTHSFTHSLTQSLYRMQTVGVFSDTLQLYGSSLCCGINFSSNSVGSHFPIFSLFLCLFFLSIL